MISDVTSGMGIIMYYGVVFGALDSQSLGPLVFSFFRLHRSYQKNLFHHYLGRDAAEVAREIVATITDPRAMVGPEVCVL